MDAHPKANGSEPKISFKGAHQKWTHLVPDIGTLVQADNDYIVYLNTNNSLQWETADDVDETEKYDPSALEEVLNRVAALEATPCAGLPLEIQLQFKQQIGEGVARALADEYKLADRMLDSAANYIRSRSQETSRFWYLTASLLTAGIFIVIGTGLWIFRKPVGDAIGAQAFWIALTAIAGAAGALLSVIGRTGKLHFDSASGKNLHYLEAASRIFAGAFSGALVGAAVMSGIILSTFVREQNLNLIQMLAAFASGASERLATSIITTLGASKIAKPGDQE